ncbi:hypothetical protein ACFTWS_37270 [Streptomyces sp. NPDC057027]|uniref:hypothetical protein n=1 Tax=Streptomyces sp. NPDC057027 TaxID=3346004 RepID=UPI003631EDCE
MNPVDLIAVVTAFLTPPIAFMAALWARRIGRQSADAAVVSGANQAHGSVAAARVQTRGELELRQQAALADTSAAFLRASDALARTVEQLPGVVPEERSAQLAAHSMAVETTFGPLELLAPPELLRHAKALRAYCRALENLALDRAVLRSAVQALKDGWCPFNAETCDHDHRSAAFVAWQFLMEWSEREDEERWTDRGLLEYCLQESQRMTEREISSLLGVVDRAPAAWSRMIGGLVRDPLMERFATLRAPFVEAARSAQPLVPPGEPDGLRAWTSDAVSKTTPSAVSRSSLSA